VQLRRLHVEHTLSSIACSATRLFDDESQRVGLVEQSELSALVLTIRRISEQAATEEIPVEIRGGCSLAADSHPARGSTT
jgi:hypothetical protein